MKYELLSIFSCFILSFCLIIGLIQCDQGADSTYDRASEESAQIIGTACDSLVMRPHLPSDVDTLNQSCANAFAWQSFLAVTWPASEKRAGQPDSTVSIDDYGNPDYMQPMTWGTFKSVEEIFKPNPPDDWNAHHEKIMSEHEQAGDCGRPLNNMHKINKSEGAMEEMYQASLKGTPWLTDQDSNIVWYEIKVNNTEFDYIVDNDFYDPKAQLDSSRNGSGIWLPEGSMEVKAAWRIIPEEKLSTLKKRYRVVKACVPSSVDTSQHPPVFKAYREQYLGLIGLHLAQKVPSSPQLLWATFEHVDLAPVQGKEVDKSKDYALFNPDCANCPVNRVPKTGETPLNKPSQIKKHKDATPGKEAMRLNDFVHKKLKAANPNSVFQYYKLVNVQWPEQPVSDGENKRTVPLADGDKTPEVMTNVSLETYKQDLSCLTCHRHSTISKNGQPNIKDFGAGYSFIFARAVPQEE